MLTIDVKNQMADLRKDVDLEKRQIRVAAQRGINTAVRGYRTDASRLLRKRYPKLKNKDILDFIEIRYSSYDLLHGAVSVRGRPLTVGRFLNVAITTRGRGGVWVNIKGVRKFIPHAWVRKGINRFGDEYTLVWHREEDHPRARAVPVKTIDLPGALNISDMRKAIEDYMIERFSKEFSRQLDRSQIRIMVG